MGSSRPVPAALLRDVVFAVGDGDVIEPVTPAAVDWPEQGADVRALADLPLAEDQLQHLHDGNAQIVRIGEAHWRLQLHDVDGARWLAVEDVSGRELAQVRQLELLRIRSLAHISASLAHDLNNHFNAALGLVGNARMTGTEDEQMLAELERGTKTGARMAGMLVRWLLSDPGERVIVGANELVDGAMAIVRKLIVSEGVDLKIVTADGLPSVRTVEVEAGQAIMHGLMALVAAKPAGIQLTMAPQPGSPTNGNRDRLRIACTATLVDSEQVEGIVTVVEGAEGMLRHAAHAPELEALAGAVFAQRRIGGDLTVAQTGDGVRLDYYWPVASSSRR